VQLCEKKPDKSPVKKRQKTDAETENCRFRVAWLFLSEAESALSKLMRKNSQAKLAEKNHSCI